jgi:hypothetical protein
LPSPFNFLAPCGITLGDSFTRWTWFQYKHNEKTYDMSTVNTNKLNSVTVRDILGPHNLSSCCWRCLETNENHLFWLVWIKCLAGVACLLMVPVVAPCRHRQTSVVHPRMVPNPPKRCRPQQAPSYYKKERSSVRTIAKSKVWYKHV